MNNSSLQLCGVDCNLTEDRSSISQASAVQRSSGIASDKPRGNPSYPFAPAAAIPHTDRLVEQHTLVPITDRDTAQKSRRVRSRNDKHQIKRTITPARKKKSSVSPTSNIPCKYSAPLPPLATHTHSVHQVSHTELSHKSRSSHSFLAQITRSLHRRSK